MSASRLRRARWVKAQLGGGSYDSIAGNLYAPGGLLNFRVRPNFRPVILNPATGEVVGS